MLYETMVFGGAIHDQHCDRYSTRAEAKAGHERTVMRLRGGLPPFPEEPSK